MMLNLNIQKTEAVNIAQTGLEDIFNISVTSTDNLGVTKSITMPVGIDSDIGRYILSLSTQVLDFKRDAEPDELSQAKARKIQAIDSEWATLEKAGWDSGQGYSLGITPSDVALLVGVFSLAKEAAVLGLELPHLISMANTPIAFANIQEMTMLLLQYGQGRSALANLFAARRKAVADATTIEEVHAQY